MNAHRLTALFLIAAVLVVYFGVLRISDREGGASPQTEQRVIEPANVYVEPPQEQIVAAPKPTEKPIWMEAEPAAGCYISDGKCKCLRRDGSISREYSDEICRKVATQR